MEYSYNLHNNFSVPYQKKGKTSESTKKRTTNIEFCKSINRSGLKYNEIEQQLEVYKTAYNETIFIQYPGKESQSTNSKPWDFRPKLLKGDGTYMHDLSFSDIWDALYDSFNHLEDKDFILRALATEFYRIAFMIDYTYYKENFEYSVRDYNNTTNSYTPFKRLFMEKPIYLYKPKAEILNLLDNTFCSILGISWEAFLVYNDLLAYNEDCKYFYHGETNTDKGGLCYISNGVGRINTMLTHISIIGFILGDIKFSDILVKAGRTRGVAPASNKELEKILGKYLVK